MPVQQMQIDLYKRRREINKELCDVLYDIDFFTNLIAWLRSGADYNSEKINLVTSVRMRLDYLKERKQKLETELQEISDQERMFENGTK